MTARALCFQKGNWSGLSVGGQQKKENSLVTGQSYHSARNGHYFNTFKYDQTLFNNDVGNPGTAMNAKDYAPQGVDPPRQRAQKVPGTRRTVRQLFREIFTVNGQLEDFASTGRVCGFTEGLSLPGLLCVLCAFAVSGFSPVHCASAQAARSRAA
jgi:hypothetical protein